MSTIADKLTQLNTIKGDIKTAINNKGGSVDDDFSTYATAINNLNTGSGETSNSYWPDFFEARTLKGVALNSDTSYYETGVYLFAHMYIKDENTKNLIENLDVSRMKYVDYMFCNFGNDDNGYCPANAINNLDLTKWDTSKFTSIVHIFDYCKLDYLNISGWDLSSLPWYIGSCSYAFYHSRIKEVNMSNCNTSTVQNFSNFVSQATELIFIDMTGCDTSAATNMNNMFSYSSKLTTITGELDLSNLTNGFYPGAYSNPVYGCSALETLYLKNIYKNCTMTNASKWSIDLSDTAVKDECLVYIINELPDLINDKGLTATDKIVLTLPKTNTLTAEQVKVATDKGWTVANTTY